jgi:TRAP-type mannitol/chloroaromatic compound transport system permease large subunit
MEFIANNMAPIMFAGLICFLLLGFPVAFSLGACGLFFAVVGIELGVLPEALMQALPLRIYGIMQNETLLAIPFFTLMGLILERSGMAEDLLDTVGQLFGPIRGGVAIAVILVGAMLAATTGVVAASVISMGLISLPIMLRYGYDRRIASGVIAASGTLAQIIPPSLVLIILADQLGRSVGDLYKGAFLPGFMLVGFYMLMVFAIAIFKPAMVPALPPEARSLKEKDGSSGLMSLLVLTILCVGVSVFAAHNMTTIHTWFTGEVVEKVAKDETIVFAMCFGVALAFVAASINRITGMGLLSHVAEKVTFVLIPPLLLIFLVLGTIFLGVATPTEGGALGAVGAMLIAVTRRKLTFALFKQALESTAQLSSFVLFILIGSTIFSFTFTAVDGQVWVEHLFDQLPGGQLGFLVFVNLLVFLLGFFLDFFEIAFILVPLLVPVANKLGIDPVWFGILLAMNLQTSFLTPPFGFALFYLRSVAPKQAYIDRVTRRRIKGIRTVDIYRGSIAFVLIQISMIVALIAFPQLVTYGLEKPVDVDLDQIRIEVQGGGDGWGQPGSSDGWGRGPAADDAADAVDSNRPGIQSGW